MTIYTLVERDRLHAETLHLSLSETLDAQQAWQFMRVFLRSSHRDNPYRYRPNGTHTLVLLAKEEQ